MFAVVGAEMNVYFDNIVLTETPEEYRFDVVCSVGETDARRWTLIAKSADIGSHAFAVTVKNSSGEDVARASMRLHVVAADSYADRHVTMLIVGDSLTHATFYPNELARLLSLPGNPNWKMLGTHRTKNAAEGVFHEGYGGWTWQRFVSHYEPNPDGTYNKRSSPFVFLNQSGKPELNVARYFDETSDATRPDVVFFLLGINDCFSVNPDDPPAIDARIDTMLEQADTLLAAFREAAPNAGLAVCITTPSNARESGFAANYEGRYHRWGWKRIQHRLVERLLEHYDSSTNQSDRVFVVPTQLNLDPLAGYPENNGVHPNALGYRQIAQSMNAWLKWWLTR